MDHVFIFSHELLCLEKNGDAYHIPPANTLQRFVERVEEVDTFFTFDQAESKCFCYELQKYVELDAPFIWVPLKSALHLVSRDWFNAIVKAHQIIRWNNNHQYCGRCGGKTQLTQTSMERHCTVCNLHFYPRISPSIIVRIHKEDQILLARAPHFPKGIYSLIAGFVEIGETIEETVRREVREEVGIEIKNICYIESQPWPFPDSLMLGFTAEYEGGHIQLNDAEIESADWYGVDNFPKYHDVSASIAKKLIEDFLYNHRL
ncbi:MAG: NAD(+) diphosphatase [Gammaproteobacteria bacterium]